MAPADFEALLNASMGLDAASIGSPAIERAVRQRQSACGLNDADAYWELVRASTIELQQLVEAVVVPETWFFRDREAFTMLSRAVTTEWLPAHPNGVLRLLSLPCSSGEEPYSIAMALIDAGVAPIRFRIDAVDISDRALKQARLGVYGRNSFRGDELTFRDRHFDATPDGYRVIDLVRATVCFEHGNIFAAGFLPGEQIYDVIYCRNVLIYFARAAQDRAIAVLRRLLTPQGLLFVAPSETALLSSHGFVSTKLRGAYSFRSADPAWRGPKPHGGIPAAGASPRRSAPPAVGAVAGTRPVRPPPPIARTVEPPADIADAVRLADQGHFVEAALQCDAYLRQHGASAKAFYLMGLVRDATGNQSEAEDYYRKAVYLDPQHHDAQIHLALLMEQRGDVAAGQVWRNRARRLKPPGEATHE
jgi:chemotaxis protein methyltransferase WspC